MSSTMCEPLLAMITHSAVQSSRHNFSILLAIITFSAVQSSTPTLIHSAIFFIDTLRFNARHNIAHSLNAKPFLTIIASNLKSLNDLETSCFTNIINGLFTLPDTHTDTDTETDKLKQYSMGLLSLCSVNTTTQFYTIHFLSVSVSGSVNTPLRH